MAAAFIGLSVKVLLNNGMSLKGHVADVDQVTQRLMLQDADEKTVRVVPTFSIAGGDIKDLQQLNSSTVNNNNNNKPHLRQHQQHDHLTVAESSATESNTRGPRRNRKTNNNNHQNNRHSQNYNNNGHYNNNNNMSDYGSPRISHQATSGKKNSKKFKEPIVHEWAQGDMEDFKDEDFDFQANLGLFDKARVFAEIREADDTAPESLLVNLNRNPNRARAMMEQQQSPMLRKLAPTENVLDPAPKRLYHRGGGGAGVSKGSGTDDDEREDDDGDNEELTSEDEEDEVEEDGDDDTADDDSWNSCSPTDSAVQSRSHKVAEAAKRPNGIKGTKVTSINGNNNINNNINNNNNNNNGSRHGSGTDVVNKKSRTAKIQTLSGVVCPAVTIQQMQQVEQLCASEMGLSEEQQIENGGRGAAMMCLQALGGSRRIQPNNHNSAPEVVILAGNNRTGAYAICAARHLSNHGCHVMVFIACAADEGQLIQAVASQSRGFVAAGGELLHSIGDLPETNASPVDLIMDGMLGYQYAVRDIVDAYERETICDLMDWANDNKAPVLSLDMPSGTSSSSASSSSMPTVSTAVTSPSVVSTAATAAAGPVVASAISSSSKTGTGHGDRTKFCVRPKWTLCLGAPKTGCRSRAVTGELFLTDLGIPQTCWKRAGVKGWRMPWGADFLVGLEYL
ncbi:enhancer of mRNA decapping [Podila humilis]|nr:enhancer of mRNA decapping [Podila humilis]